MYSSIAATSSGTLWNTPRRIRFRVIPPEPALYQVQPRHTRRRKVKNVTRMFVQPSFHVRVTVSSVIVQNHVDPVQVLGYFSVDLCKLEEIPIPMPRVAGADDLSLQHVQALRGTWSRYAL